MKWLEKLAEEQINISYFKTVLKYDKLSREFELSYDGKETYARGKINGVYTVVLKCQKYYENLLNENVSNIQPSFFRSRCLIGCECKSNIISTTNYFWTFCVSFNDN